MAPRRISIPNKLKNDAIVEAAFEIRFDTKTIPEILFGRLADYLPWKEFDQRQMPALQIPASIRQADSNLRYQPVIELVEPDGHYAVRLGPHVLSCHRVSPYVGWDAFRPALEQSVDGLFQKAEGLVINRLGLRYMNALREDIHGIRSVADLDLQVAVAGETIPGKVNLNFTTDLSKETSCTVRIATTDYVQGILPVGTTVYVDVDVFTREGFSTVQHIAVKDWIESAHITEKQNFFRLLTEESINNLKEK